MEPFDSFIHYVYQTFYLKTNAVPFEVGSNVTVIFKEIESVTQVQILDETVFIPFCAHTLEKKTRINFFSQGMSSLTWVQ